MQKMIKWKPLLPVKCQEERVRNSLLSLHNYVNKPIRLFCHGIIYISYSSELICIFVYIL